MNTERLETPAEHELAAYRKQIREMRAEEVELLDVEGEILERLKAVGAEMIAEAMKRADTEAPLSLLSRLAASVPAPRSHQVRYAGVLASASKIRPLIIPKPKPAEDADARRARHAEARWLPVPDVGRTAGDAGSRRVRVPAVP